MQTIFLSSFSRDIDKINNKKTLKALKDIIINVESAKTIKEISGLKKLKGYRTAYRIRIGDYRLGLFIYRNKVELVRFIHRKEIYKKFP